MNKKQLDDIKEVGIVLGQATFKETTLLIEEKRSERMQKFIKALNELYAELNQSFKVVEEKTVVTPPKDSPIEIKTENNIAELETNGDLAREG